MNKLNKVKCERLFTDHSINEWISSAASKPVPRRLFDNFWSEGELSILFADTGSGKSALAMQIAESICTGVPLLGFEMDAPQQGVLYFDFELTEMQLQRRYAVELREERQIWFENHYQFHESLRRVEINGAANVFDNVPDWETLLINELAHSIEASGCSVVILDNVTFLIRENEKIKFALPLMQRLNDLKKEHSLSILVLAHTPKIYETTPISLNHLAGSKVLANFSDSIFAIGKSQKDSSLRYLKQLKARSTEVVYDTYNVPVFRFEKKDNFLGFEFIEYDEESEHLLPSSKTDRAELVERVKELSGQGRSQREIARELGISLGFVNKLVNSVNT